MKLTPAQIEKLASSGASCEASAGCSASPKAVKRIAVENFLGTLGGSTAYEATQNLYADAASYKWNAATVNAIRKGIELANSPYRIRPQT